MMPGISMLALAVRYRLVAVPAGEPGHAGSPPKPPGGRRLLVHRLVEYARSGTVVKAAERLRETIGSLLHAERRALVDREARFVHHPRTVPAPEATVA